MTTVGYGDIYPITTLGKSYAILLFLTGIGLYGVVIGKTVEWIGSYHRKKVEGKLDYKGNNHIIIIGWNSKTDAAINEILANESFDIVVIDQLEKAPYIKDRVFYVQGSPARREVLLKANLPMAKSCIVFADEKIVDIDERDAKSLLIISTIESLSKTVYTIVEIMNEEHTINFENNKVEKFLYPQSTISHLVAQEAMNHGVIDILKQLGTLQNGVNLYIVEKKEGWITYRDAFLDLLELGVILLADKNHVNIGTMLDKPIPPDNHLIVICSKEVYEQHFKK